MLKPILSILISSAISVGVVNAVASKKPIKGAQTSQSSTNINEDKVLVMENQVDLTRNYDADDANFMPGLIAFKGTTKRKYSVFVNIHGGGELQTGAWIPGKTKRSLTWLVPYEQALIQAMSHTQHAHQQSALLTSWSGHTVRNFVSFVIIPQDTLMEFKIGYASPQASKKAKEVRPGGGMQIRLKYVPKGTIVLTEQLTAGDQSKTYEKGTGKKGKQTFNLPNLLKSAIENYNSTSTNKLPADLIHSDLGITNEKDYIKRTMTPAT